MKRSKKGFTLAELLVVVAIIGILVAIAIPTFSASQKKAQNAVYKANARSAYAEAVTNVVSEDADYSTTGYAKTYDGIKYTVTGKDGVYTVTLTKDTKDIMSGCETSYTFGK